MSKLEKYSVSSDLSVSPVISFKWTVKQLQVVVHTFQMTIDKLPAGIHKVPAGTNKIGAVIYKFQMVICKFQIATEKLRICSRDNSKLLKLKSLRKMPVKGSTIPAFTAFIQRYPLSPSATRRGPLARDVAKLSTRHCHLANPAVLTASSPGLRLWDEVEDRIMGKLTDGTLTDLDTVIQVWSENPSFAMGDLTLTGARNKRTDLAARSDAVDEARTTLSRLIDEESDARSQVDQIVTRARSGMRATFGPDSTQYAQVGGTRASERKPRARKAGSGSGGSTTP